MNGSNLYLQSLKNAACNDKLPLFKQLKIEIGHRNEEVLACLKEHLPFSKEREKAIQEKFNRAFPNTEEGKRGALSRSVRGLFFATSKGVVKTTARIGIFYLISITPAFLFSRVYPIPMRVILGSGIPVSGVITILFKESVFRQGFLLCKDAEEGWGHLRSITNPEKGHFILERARLIKEVYLNYEDSLDENDEVSSEGSETEDDSQVGAKEDELIQSLSNIEQSSQQGGQFWQKQDVFCETYSIKERETVSELVQKAGKKLFSIGKRSELTLLLALLKEKGTKPMILWDLDYKGMSISSLVSLMQYPWNQEESVEHWAIILSRIFREAPKQDLQKFLGEDSSTPQAEGPCFSSRKILPIGKRLLEMDSTDAARFFFSTPGIALGYRWDWQYSKETIEKIFGEDFSSLPFSKETSVIESPFVFVALVDRVLLTPDFSLEQKKAFLKEVPYFSAFHKDYLSFLGSFVRNAPELDREAFFEMVVNGVEMNEFSSTNVLSILHPLDQVALLQKIPFSQFPTKKILYSPDQMRDLFSLIREGTRGGELKEALGIQEELSEEEFWQRLFTLPGEAESVLAPLEEFWQRLFTLPGEAESVLAPLEEFWQRLFTLPGEAESVLAPFFQEHQSFREALSGSAELPLREERVEERAPSSTSRGAVDMAAKNSQVSHRKGKREKTVVLFSNLPNRPKEKRT